MKPSAFIIAFIVLIALAANCQKVVEVSIKPMELLFLNFETHIGIGTAKTRYGLLLSFRPSTQDSGLAKSGGTGAAGGYGYRYNNRLYRAYTVGLYNKVYINKALDVFLETDIFYRNWHFDKKPAEYRNVEKTMQEFKGVRTENVDVYCLKLLVGQTLPFKTKREVKFKPYADVYIGAGIRYQKETYETFNGTVGGTFYAYKKDRSHYVWPTPQLGVKVGLLNRK